MLQNLNRLKQFCLDKFLEYIGLYVYLIKMWNKMIQIWNNLKQTCLLIVYSHVLGKWYMLYFLQFQASNLFIVSYLVIDLLDK